ncbi:uncharacterized protein LOC144925345 [Branchiostoma floridae x Branchiostoma belcheri]
MGVDLCTYRARIGCFRNLRLDSQCCSPEAPCLLMRVASCLLVWMVISQLLLKLAGDVEENPGPRQQNISMTTLSRFKNKVETKEWDMMGKRTLLTLDLSCECNFFTGSSINPLAQLPEKVFELKELEALDLTDNENIDLSDQLTKLTNLKVLCLEGCGLKTVPTAVMKLPQLEMLILRNNKNISLPDEMSGLTNLTVLHLDSCNLQTIPPVVLKLTNLQELDLSKRKNSAEFFEDDDDESQLWKISLPDALYRLNKLKVLRLRGCNLDTVPSAVLKLPQLEELDLSGNSRIHLPDGLAGLTNLRVLGLKGTDMRTVPRAVWRLTQLERLDLSWTQLQTLPAEIGHLTNVKHLNLSGCELRTFPPEVGRLTQLERLDLSHNQLQTLPAEIGQLTDVKHLDLSLCELRTLPPEVGRLTQLERLDLSGNQLQTLPAEIGHLTNVKHLHVFYCKLRTLPPEVGRMTQLERLDLSGNQLQTLPAEIGQLTNVKHLDLSECELRTLPPEVGRLTQLERLGLTGNQLQTLPAEIGQLTNVKHLNLSGCKLRTLPPEVGGLTQLEWLDLRGNQLQTLPAEIGQLTNVKHLGLSHCEMRTLPPEVGRLTQLEWLGLSHNQLQTLPAEIGQLTNVKHFDLSHCEMRTLPPEVGRLTQLEWLGLSHNQLQTLHAEIGQLTNVKHLDLSDCELRTLPPEVGRLTQLEWLGLSHNQLQTLPTQVGQLRGLQALEVGENPLIKPPAEVCSQGIVAIMQYFDELERSEEAISAHLKVVVLGETMAGKTSLVQTLDSGKSTLTEVEDRTQCVEITRWAPDDNITFEVYDFGGHDVYHLTHQFFLTPDAFYLLLVNLQTYSCSEERYTEAVGFWLDTLKARVPGAVVSIVGSKKDLCRPDEVKTKTNDVQARIRLQCEMWEKEQRQIQTITNTHSKSVENIGQHHLRGRFLLKPELRIVGDALDLCVSVKPKSRFLELLSRSSRSWVKFKDFLLETTNDNDLFPRLRRILPRTWVEFEQLVQRQASTETSDWLTVSDCAQLGQLARLSSERVEPVLSYLQQVGTILRYTDIPKLKDLVFHDPPALIEIFKDLFHHDVKKLFKTPRLKNADYTRTQLDDFEQDLRDCGLIQKKVMSYMLPPNIDPDVVIALMQDFGLCFELKAKNKTDPSKHACQYRITWYLHKQLPEELMNVWPDDVPEDQEQLQLMCNITGFCPRGLFQRFSVGIHQLIEDRIDWKDGVMAYRQAYRRDYPVLVRSNPVADDTYITMATRGRLALADEMWGVVHPLLEVLVQLLQEWPGVLYSLHVTCAHCIKAGLDRPYQHELRDRTAEDGRDVRCPRVKKTESTSADLVYRPGRLSVSSHQLKRPPVHDVYGKDPRTFAGNSPGGKPVVLLVNDEFGTSKGGISTVNGQLGDLLTSAGAKVLITVLNATEAERQEALKHGIDLVLPISLKGDKGPPELIWLTEDHKVRYPNIPSDISVIVGHADVTSTAARNIKKDRLPSAKFILFNHVMPEDTEHYKSLDKAMSIGDKMKAIREDTEEADVVFSVGPTMHDYYENQIRLSRPHHLFLPKPSDIFSQMDVTYVETKTKVVLCVGRVKGVEKLKGYDLVAKAMATVIERCGALEERLDVRLRVRGISAEDFPESKEIIQANIEKGTSRFTPLKYATQEELSNDFKEAHLVLMPSRIEPFGLVGLEAIAAGVPVLVSGKSGLAEFLQSRGAEFSRLIVDIDGSDAVVAEGLAERIIEILKGGQKMFQAAKRLKDKLLASEYWNDAHRKFLEECGIPL